MGSYREDPYNESFSSKFEGVSLGTMLISVQRVLELCVLQFKGSWSLFSKLLAGQSPPKPIRPVTHMTRGHQLTEAACDPCAPSMGLSPTSDSTASLTPIPTTPYRDPVVPPQKVRLDPPKAPQASHRWKRGYDWMGLGLHLRDQVPNLATHDEFL